MTADNSHKSGKNQGEGDRESAKRYNKDTREFMAENDVSAKAREAEKALSGSEGRDLKQAEEKGKARARGEDPQVRRD